MSDDFADAVSKALRRAYSLGQTYWQQADSESYSQNRKADDTSRKFAALVDETLALARSGQAASGSSHTARSDVLSIDVVEQRLLTWRQRFMNKSGDRLALDDFMGQESIDDLIDFVCSPPAQSAEQGATPPAPAAPTLKRDYCPEKLKPGGCQLHNLHCGYPKCNAAPAAEGGAS